MSKQATLFNFFKKSTPDAKPQKEANLVKIKGLDLRVLDLVWCKLDGYPWWPSIICEHPSSNTFIRKKEIHVQFFEDPPTRGWVKESFVKKYGSPEQCGIPTYRDPLWLKAKEEADGASLLNRVERVNLIVEHQLSDAEEMQDEISLDDSEGSKENIDLNISQDYGKRRHPSDDGESSKTSNKKRRIVFISDSEVSEDEYNPEKEGEHTEEDSESSGSDAAVNSSDESMSSREPSPSPVKAEIQKSKPSQPKSSSKRNISFSTEKCKFSKEQNNSSISEDTKSVLSSFSIREPLVESESVNTVGNWPHTKLEFLKPKYIKDKNNRRPDHPDYNPRTLFVTEDFLNKQTPALRQWWKLKSDHYDTVLFFKMGKFYELFNMDAVISIQELGLLMMRGENAHTGFPESAFGRYSSTLIEKGYKVARIEQTETPDMMEKRCKKMMRTTKFDKVVERELCCITSRATRIPSVMDGDSEEAEGCYLLSVTEKNLDGAGEMREFGVSFIDTTIGKFFIGQFLDDRHISRLRTLVSHYPPAQVIYEGGHLSTQTHQLLKSIVPENLHEKLASEKEFWTAAKTLQYLRESDYFKNEGQQQWPPIFEEICDKEDAIGMSPSKGHELGISAMGGLIFYLRLCQVEDDLLTRKLFENYAPPDSSSVFESTPRHPELFKKHLILDGTTLQNLEVFQNSSGGNQGTLFEVINHCHTSFGKRLLYCWVCSPLRCSSAINNRLDAIEDLIHHKELVSTIGPLLKKLPDLQRLLSKIHSLGLKRKPEHPDSRAIIFGHQQYSQKKVLDFLTALNGFQTAQEIQEAFQDEDDLKSSYLKNIMINKEKGGKFPSLKEPLKFFKKAFNETEAKKEGKIIPFGGVDPEYDSAMTRMEETTSELNDYLSKQTKYFGIKVTYVGTEKKRYQLEVPEHAAKKAGDEYEFVSQRKGYKRFWTPTTKRLLAEVISAEDMKTNALKDVSRRIFSQFDERAKEWSSAIECLSALDALLSLAKYSESVPSCRPEVESSGDIMPFINIVEGRHPCNIKVFGDTFIPNDLRMGEDETKDSHAPLILVTGPNMGGKSTLMRQTALICLLAQLGCYVPATRCHITATDRIFTRLGARDRIFQGESTFYVELAETSTIIQHSTRDSLVLIDELGRGTATYDGIAIASSVVETLSKIGCRTLFSTHYHSLVDEFKTLRGISLGHMSCMVEGETAETTPSEENVTFLYKFIEGACPKSYGFNAARLADISDDLVRSATLKAHQLENVIRKKKVFSLLFKSSDKLNVQQRSLLLTLKDL